MNDAQSLKTAPSMKNQWYDPAIDVVKKDLNQHCMQGNCTFNRVMRNLLMEQLDKDGKTIGFKNCSHSINAPPGYCTQSM